MASGKSRIDRPANEPQLAYRGGSEERSALRAALEELKTQRPDIPLVIGGKEVRTGRTSPCKAPHDHGLDLGRYHKGGPDEVAMAIEAAHRARPAWESLPWEERLAVFLKAADLLAGPYRFLLNGATMLGQSKNVRQAEIDAACELCDFLRFNAHFAQRIYEDQPHSGPGTWNRLEQRALEGFVFAATPFNFTAIAGNLPCAPAMMGNTVVWKPASSAVLSGHWLMRLFQEAGLPDGVINFVPGSGSDVGDAALAHEELAGIHFTGSTAVFQSMWKTVGDRIASYKTYPRIVGETGGKDFVFLHETADVEAASVALVRGAFEYQGQKCSAASRCYVPDLLWPQLRELVLAKIEELRVGDVEDFATHVNAVIDEKAYQRIMDYLREAKADSDVEVLVGGGGSSEKGWFVEPTVLVCANPKSRTMVEEIFGPVLSIWVYPASKVSEALDLCDETSPYALTGAIFARDRGWIHEASQRLLHAAGNFYVNDKPTGSVVGQQPFGGSRASGTNDKAGSPLNLSRWISARSIKESFLPAQNVGYPYMDDED